MSRWIANLMLLGAGAVWGMGFIAQSTAMDHIGPLSFVAFRFLIAAIVLLPFAWRESKRTDVPAIDAGVLLRFGLIGAAMFGGMATQQVGLVTTTVSNSGFLTGLYVVLTPLVAIVLFREYPPLVVWPGAALALLGIFLLSGGDLAALSKGDVLTIVSAVFWALQVVLIARFVVSSGRPFLLAAAQFTVVAVLAAMLIPFSGETVQLESMLSALPHLIYAGVFAGALAFTLQIVAQRYTTSSQAAIFLSSEAPFAALLGAVILGERLGTLGLLGCAAILASMLLVELAPDRNRKLEPPRADA